jgi:Protein of unknown function (DUF3276)
LIFLLSNKILQLVEEQKEKQEPAYSSNFRAGRKRTYFFDIRQTKTEDYYLVMTESSRRKEGGYNRQRIVLYKEDLKKFIESMEESLDFFKSQLMPDFNFDTAYQENQDRMAAEREERDRLRAESGDPEMENTAPKVERIEREAFVKPTPAPVPTSAPVTPPSANTNNTIDDDMSW